MIAVARSTGSAHISLDPGVPLRSTPGYMLAPASPARSLLSTDFTDTTLMKRDPAMNEADDSQCEYEDLIADDETWESILERRCCKDPNCAQTFAELLFALKQAADSGPEGVRCVRETLLEGIRCVYLYTDAHRLALDHYLLSLEGDLKPWDEPVQLLTEAIERGKKETQRARVREREILTQRARRKAAKAREESSPRPLR
jgi:hypothetical protein